MGRFLVDEDMPRSTSVVLREVEPHRIRIRRPASDRW